jgi:hypothetical protein
MCVCVCVCVCVLFLFCCAARASRDEYVREGYKVVLHPPFTPCDPTSVYAFTNAVFT